MALRLSLELHVTSSNEVRSAAQSPPIEFASSLSFYELRLAEVGTMEFLWFFKRYRRGRQILLWSWWHLHCCGNQEPDQTHTCGIYLTPSALRRLCASPPGKLQPRAWSVQVGAVFWMVWTVSNEEKCCEVPWWINISVIFASDHYSADPAATPIKATGHHLVTLYQSSCAEERFQNPGIPKG